MEILLVEGNKPLSKIIKNVIGYPYSHTVLRYSHPNDDWLIHSSVGGVQLDRWRFFKQKYPNIKRYFINFKEADLVADNMIDKIIHRNYGYSELLGAGIVIFLERLKIYLKKNPFHNNHTFLCTEVIAYFFSECNKHDPSLKLNEFKEEILTPKTLDNYLMSRSDIFSKVD